MIRFSFDRFRQLARWVFLNKPRQSLAELATLWKVQVLLRLFPRESTRAFAAAFNTPIAAVTFDSLASLPAFLD